MKKIIALFAIAILLSSCGITYYTYYEVDSLETATAISRQDAAWSPYKSSPTRVVAAYQDSTGCVKYLIESKTYDTIKQENSL